MTMMPEDFDRMENADLLNLVAAAKERDRLRAEVEGVRQRLDAQVDAHEKSIRVLTAECDRLSKELHRYRCALVLDADKHLSPETVSAELALAIIDRDAAIKAAENEKIDHGVTVELLAQAQRERDAARAMLRKWGRPISAFDGFRCRVCESGFVATKDQIQHRPDCAWQRAMGDA